MKHFTPLTRKALLCLFVCCSLNSFAKENIGSHRAVNTRGHLLGKGAGCAAATAQKDLAINNVRTAILNGGDMWWDLSGPRYEIPKVTGSQTAKHSLFASAMWVGGLSNGNIRLAAQTYRQSGNDYYPGPLENTTASINRDECLKYDRIWSVTLAEIASFRSNSSAWANPIDAIATWPAHGSPGTGQGHFLAPFVNQGGDPLVYEPSMGDYPAFVQNKTTMPDQMLFYIINDKGNVHTETSGIPLGLEMQVTAFAYSTSDEINNTTFYRTTLINRGNETLDSMVIARWVDADLGNYSDDFVGCDVTRNLGICYNGDDNDEGPAGYGMNPPAVGVQMLQGPRLADGTVLGMNKFVYYENTSSHVNGNPATVSDHWNLMRGRWKTGAMMTYGTNGVSGIDTASYMFPGTTDPAARANWTESSSGNTPGDRRFIMSTGPFSMLPGAVNTVTEAVVWARATSGGAAASVALLKQASDKAYTFFHSTIRSGVSEQVQAVSAVKAYPNPGTSEFSIAGLPPQADHVVMYDLSGRVCLKAAINAEGKVITPYLGAGSYMYSVNDRNGRKVATGRWIKE